MASIGLIWDEFEDEDVLFEFPPGKDRILASYDAGREKAAYVEPIAVGDVLPDMPLFLFAGRHIKVPLEATYQTTWSVLPRELQVIVETGDDNARPAKKIDLVKRRKASLPIVNATE